MKIAVIGSGISGLTAAYLLHKHHEITVFESADRMGGHTATVDVSTHEGEFAIDTGFIVYNDHTYPNFISLMSLLGVETKPTTMGFSVTSDHTDFEYSGAGLGTLFAQRRNLFSLSHWHMLRDIMRFNREATIELTSGALPADITLGEYLHNKRYSNAFIHRYLIPMGSAIWSASLHDLQAFPLQFFVHFFHNHGLLKVKDRPQWRVLVGGSRAYLEPLTRGFTDRIQLQTHIKKITRSDSGVMITWSQGSEPAEVNVSQFDQVVLACHSDQALAMLGDASSEERNILQALPYRDNDVVLHTDTSLLPKRKSVWSSWNYRLGNDSSVPPVLTYNMNILQGITTQDTFCVTLNYTAGIDPAKILGRFSYAHPQFSMAGIAAQKKWHRINGINRTWYCGAYWRNGFHEDGVVSGARVANHILAGAGAMQQDEDIDIGSMIEGVRLA